MKSGSPISSICPRSSISSIQVAIAVSHSDSEASTDVYASCLKNNGPVKARPSDFEFAVHEISNNGEVTEELEELGILEERCGRYS